MDLGADGRQDIANFAGALKGYYERTECSEWESFTAFESFPNLDIDDPNLKFIDIDGDGITDILVSEDNVMAWYQSLGDDGFLSRQFASKSYDGNRREARLQRPHRIHFLCRHERGWVARHRPCSKR